MNAQALQKASWQLGLSLAVAIVSGLGRAAEGAVPVAEKPTPNPIVADMAAKAVVDAATGGTSQVISLTLSDVPLAEVVQLFMRISGANIIAAASNLTGQVTASLQDVPWRPAFESILERQSLTLVEKPPCSNIFVIEGRKAGEDPRISTTVKLKYAKVADMAAMATSVLGKDGTITPFASGNSIVINASALKAAELQKIITELDFPRTQVSIETKIVQLTDGSSKDLGIDWQGLNNYNISAAGGLSGGALGSFSHASANANNGGVVPTAIPSTTVGLGTLRSLSAVLTPDKFNVVLHMLEGASGAKTISNPKIIVANEEKALIKMATDEPNIKITIIPATVANTANQITSALDTSMPFFTYGITVEVTPRINTSSNITITIKPELSAKAITAENPTGEKTAPDMNTFPIIDKKSVETVFSLADGSTAAIGGLITTTDSDTTSKVPLLGDIPFLGKWLFSYKGRTKSQAEVLIFVTVRLIDPQAALDATQLPIETSLYTKQHPRDSALYTHADPGMTNTATAETP